MVKHALPLMMSATLALATGCSGDDKKTAQEPVAADQAATGQANPEAGDEIANDAATDSGVAEVAENLKPETAPNEGIASLTLVNPDPPAAEEEATNYLWAQIDGLVIRDKPSLKGKKVGELAYGERVEVLEETHGFVKIGEGRYVARRKLTDRKAHFYPRKEPAQPEVAH